MQSHGWTEQKEEEEEADDDDDEVDKCDKRNPLCGLFSLLCTYSFHFLFHLSIPALFFYHLIG